MRFAAILFALVLAVPAFAAGWTSYTNSRYGASADVPPGYVPTGPEAPNSDGLTFWDKRGGMVIIFGAVVPGGNFESYAESWYDHALNYDNYSNVAKTITPTWAEITGSSGHKQMQMRILSSCNGRQAVAVQYTANSLSGSVWSRLKNSLRAGPATSC